MKYVTLSMAMVSVIASSAAALTASAATTPNTNYKGTVTQLTAGTGIILTPDPITTTGTIAIDGSVVPQSGGSNTFTGDQTIIGNLTVTGDLTLGGTINSGFIVEPTDGTSNIYGGDSFSGTISDIVGVTLPGGANAAYDSYVTVGGGASNGAGISDGTDVGQYSTIGGGYGNSAYDSYSTIGGGIGNEAGKADGTAAGSTIAGGVGNRASGMWSMVPGGAGNTAQGKASFAAGTHAKALNNGSFVWGDNFTNDEVTDGAANQFIARSTGGVAFYTCYNEVTKGFCAGATLASGSGSWASVSDRDSKANFAPVEEVELLRKLDAIPIETWNYKSQDPSIRHMGPVAQDFRAAFGLGEDDKHISSVDADGVALAAVQALYRSMLKKDELIQKQAAEIQELKVGMQALQSEVRQAAASHAGGRR